MFQSCIGSSLSVRWPSPCGVRLFIFWRSKANIWSHRSANGVKILNSSISPGKSLQQKWRWNCPHSFLGWKEICCTIRHHSSWSTLAGTSTKDSKLFHWRWKPGTWTGGGEGGEGGLVERERGERVKGEGEGMMVRGGKGGRNQNVRAAAFYLWQTIAFIER